jgi:DNA repair ATPase RecN
MGMAALFALALGCGSSGDETTSSPSLSRDEFITQANAICDKVAKENKAALASLKKEYESEANKKANNADNFEVIDLAMKEVVSPSIRTQAEELEALTPPAKDQDQVTQMIQRLSKAGKVLAADGYEGLTPSRFSQFQREASAYGLESCVGRLIY